ncbi:hypothetical protein BH10PSE7_BH10PSE7_16480 [soil metagenome]
MQHLASLARYIRSWLSEAGNDDGQVFPFVRHGDRSGAELFLDQVMADERGVRHQLFVTRP